MTPCTVLDVPMTPAMVTGRGIVGPAVFAGSERPLMPALLAEVAETASAVLECACTPQPVSDKAKRALPPEAKPSMAFPYVDHPTTPAPKAVAAPLTPAVLIGKSHGIFVPSQAEVSLAVDADIIDGCACDAGDVDPRAEYAGGTRKIIRRLSPTRPLLSGEPPKPCNTSR